MVFSFLLAGTATALAAPPSNDDFANAVNASALPFSDAVDTTEATVEATDRQTKCSAPQNTVWYKVTPTSDGFLRADTIGSDYDTTLAILTGAPGDFTVVGCNDDANRTLQSKLVWNAEAGTTYYAMVGTCCGSGTILSGNLQFNVDTSEPPFSLDGVSLNASATVNASTGVITTSGTVTCSNGPDRVRVFVRVVQKVGRLLILGEKSKRIECDGTSDWSVRVKGSNGLYVAGKADGVVSAASENEFLRARSELRVRG